MGLFGKDKAPKDQVNEWCGKLRKEGYQLDRQIRSIQREEQKAVRLVKDAAKKGDKDVAKVLAKEIVRSRKAVARIYASKAQLNSVQMEMKNILATVKVTGSIAKSTEVMKSMQRLVNIPELSKTMNEMSREMMKMGIIEEMLEDTMEGLDGEEEVEEEAQEEIDKILWEVTAGKLGEAPNAVTAEPGGASVSTATEEEPEDDIEEMKERLEALRS